MALSTGPERFGALQRRVTGIAKVLVEHLRLLERANVVERAAHGTHAQPVYQLSPKGLSLLGVIAAIQSLQAAWELANDAAAQCRADHQPLSLPADS